MTIHKIRATAMAAAMLSIAMSATDADAQANSTASMAQSQLEVAQAAAKAALDSYGLQLSGYMRSGAYYAKDGLSKGQYSVGQLGFTRLGNEGDHYLEFGIGKKWQVSGVKLGTYWMPYLYNAQGVSVDGTKQVYVDMTGLSFAPELSFWAGQRYHRIQDVHIIDQWLMEDGDNFGAGVDKIGLGGMGGWMNVAVYNEGNTDNSTTTSNGKRLNVQLREIPVAPGGTLNLTAGVVRGKFADKTTSFALGALYNQKFGVLTNSLFVQGSNGHSDLRGKFYALNGETTTTTTTSSPFVCTVVEDANGNCPTAAIAPNPNPTTVTVTTTTNNPGAKQFRIVDSINWQSGPFGGQAFVGYQSIKPDNGPKTTNLGVGGRLSYGVAPHVKLLGELNIGTLKTDGSGTRRLDKETVAIAISPTTDFWSRPEIRLYVSRVGGNNAVKADSFGGRSSAILAGVQVEAWWE